jgi:hypothetical protein
LSERAVGRGSSGPPAALLRPLELHEVDAAHGAQRPVAELEHAMRVTGRVVPADRAGGVEVLERLGHEVVFPEEHTCCGQMHFNTG